MSSRPLVFPVLLATWLIASACSAQSLWDKRDPNKAFLFYDVQARRVGDLLTVVINENTGVDNRERRSLSKGSESKNKFGFNFAGAGAAGGVDEDFSADSGRKFDGSASYSSERDFSDRITVTVLDVLPNGNLVVGGKRKVLVEGDAKLLAISGIARPQDVRADNTIQSRYLSSFEIAYQGDGIESRFTKQSWLGRFCNWIWPF